MTQRGYESGFKQYWPFSCKWTFCWETRLTHTCIEACMHTCTHTHLALPLKGTHHFPFITFSGTSFCRVFWYFTMMFKAVDLLKLIILAQGRRFMWFSVLSTFLLYFRLYHIFLFVFLMYDFVRESLTWSSSFPNYFTNFIMIFQNLFYFEDRMF